MNAGADGKRTGGFADSFAPRSRRNGNAWEYTMGDVIDLEEHRRKMARRRKRRNDAESRRENDGERARPDRAPDGDSSSDRGPEKTPNT